MKKIYKNSEMRKDVMMLTIFNHSNPISIGTYRCRYAVTMVQGVSDADY